MRSLGVFGYSTLMIIPGISQQNDADLRERRQRGNGMMREWEETKRKGHGVMNERDAKELGDRVVYVRSPFVFGDSTLTIIPPISTQSDAESRETDLERHTTTRRLKPRQSLEQTGKRREGNTGYERNETREIVQVRSLPFYPAETMRAGNLGRRIWRSYDTIFVNLVYPRTNGQRNGTPHDHSRRQSEGTSAPNKHVTGVFKTERDTSK